MPTLAKPKKKPSPQKDYVPSVAVFIAMNLLELRLAAKLTQRQLAERAEVSLRRVASIESAATANVTIKTLERLAAVLGVKVKDFLKERTDYVRV